MSLVLLALGGFVELAFDASLLCGFDERCFAACPSVFDLFSLRSLWARLLVTSAFLTFVDLQVSGLRGAEEVDDNGWALVDLGFVLSASALASHVPSRFA